MNIHEYMWLKLSFSERDKLLKFLQDGKKVAAIRHVRSIAHVDLKKAKQFVDSNWLWKRVPLNPTRLAPKDAFRMKVLQVVTNMLSTVNDTDMLVTDKYDTLTKISIPELFDLCMEEN